VPGANLYRRVGKRGLDVALAGVALAVVAPILAVVSVVLWIVQGRPILFRQLRPGWRGRLFEIIKLRTMRRVGSGELASVPDARRLTAVGRFLRRTSLDELPELINVLRGDMSLVGPRPLLPEYLPLYTPEQARRHEVRPGITGWTQVNGRNALSWEQKFRLDVWYVDHVSFALDLEVIALTAWAVLRGVGVSAEGHATMGRFTGGSEGGT
jgi:lipopolysaccharide/colanic/teichoic acid biosynthesis glycosyltransferase